ncbi:MAG: cell division inhibitor [Aeromonas molluscorum]
MNQPMSRPLAPLIAGLTQPWPTRYLSRRPSSPASGAEFNGSQLLGALSQASQAAKGWILLIAPPGLPIAAQLQASGINPAHVLVVHGHKIKNWQRTLEQALSQSRCAAVLTWLPETISLDTGRLHHLSQHHGVLTHYFHAQSATDKAVHYAGQDIYLNH